MSAPTSNQNGTAALTSGGSEVVLGSAITSAGTYQLILDGSPLALGDEIEIRVYNKVLSGSTERLTDIWTIRNALIVPNLYSPIYPTLYDLKFSLKQTTGSSRSIDWNIVQLA
jgi:hypothetical protein